MNVSQNAGFSTYWTAEGIGLTGWRVYANLYAYDRCNHGEILGNVSVYSANVKYKGGDYRVWISYTTSYQTRWTTALVNLHRYSNSGGWDLYYITTDNNIGLSSTGRITNIKISSYLIFNRVSGAGRRIECSMIYRTCPGHLGV